MSAARSCRLIGCWRLVEADIWDKKYLNLCGPAKLKIGGDGRGEIAFGALQATLRIDYAKQSIWFDWEGFDEMDQVDGTGSAHLEHGSLEIEFAFSGGDEAVLKAVKA
ncbi:MAG: hypothetical protein KGO02_12920 [Alphaproteobacteria bacterium]|nr:hypothetical protein [Alphaproteobacteria bacterium]